MHAMSTPTKIFQKSNISANDMDSIKKVRIGDYCSELYDENEDENGESLKPEMKLDRLGYYIGGSVDYSQVSLPSKTNLYQELYKRISNYINTDVQVIIGQEEFSCHSMVLQTYSEFFMKNNTLRTFELPESDVTVNAFITIYDWMITGEDCVQLLKRENILEVFIASRYLEMKELEEQCWAFIDSEDIFSEDSAFLLYVEAKKRQIESVKELMIPRIRGFFLMLVSSQDFVELDADELCVLLSSNYIAVNCEMEVLMSAVRWLKYDWDGRIKHVIRVMGCIRFGLIAPWQLVDLKRNPENPELLEILNIPEITKMVDDGLSFVIIKYWYGHQSGEYAHWIELLGLREPVDRNWSGSERSYITYRQFLKFLDAYRRDNLLERNKVKPRRAEPGPAQLEACLPPPALLTPIPTIDEFLAAKDAAECKSCADSQSQTQSSRSLSEDEAAKKIQSVYRGFAARRSLGKQRGRAGRRPKPRSPQAFPQSFQVYSLFSTAKGSPHRPHGAVEPGAPPSARHKLLRDGSLFSHDRECVLIFGGVDPHAVLGSNRNTAKDIYHYLPESNSWDYVGELPAPRCYHSTVFYRGRVYLAGGNVPSDHGPREKCTTRNTVWSFDPVTREWFDECPMITPRKYFGFVVCSSKMFVVGGEGPHGTVLSSVERYDQGRWEEMSPMRTPRTGVSCARHKDHIWAAGGVTGSRRHPITESVECYNVKLNEWTKIENLRFPRSYSTLFTMHDKIYLVGGVGKFSDKQAVSVSSIDVWDPSAREWRLETELAVPRHGHAIAHLGTQILIIGGVTTVYMRALSSAECYCCERNTWVRGVAPTPIMLSGHSAVTLPPVSLL